MKRLSEIFGHIAARPVARSGRRMARRHRSGSTPPFGKADPRRAHDRAATEDRPPSIEDRLRVYADPARSISISYGVILKFGSDKDHRRLGARDFVHGCQPVLHPVESRLSVRSSGVDFASRADRAADRILGRGVPPVPAEIFLEIGLVIVVAAGLTKVSSGWRGRLRPQKERASLASFIRCHRAEVEASGEG